VRCLCCDQIVGPKADAERIPGIDIQVADGDSWHFGDLEMKVFDTPGHTRGHISFWLPEAKALFCGEIRQKCGGVGWWLVIAHRT
jgi:hydroxyacylglutathione hydrolase